MNLYDSYSHEGTLGMKTVRSALRKYGGKTCLDIGCGLFKRPAYMIEEIEWIGIDPQEAEHDFPFIRAYAESLPFNDNSFDSVLFATTIDHVRDPQQAISEAVRVLKPGGHIIVWLTLRPRNKYYIWKRSGKWYDKNHPQAFIEESLLDLVPCKFVEKINIKWSVNIFVWTCTT